MASFVQDWSLYSIGGAVLLAYMPQLWFEYRIISASGGQFSNVLSVAFSSITFPVPTP